MSNWHPADSSKFATRDIFLNGVLTKKCYAQFRIIIPVLMCSSMPLCLCMFVRFCDKFAHLSFKTHTNRIINPALKERFITYVFIKEKSERFLYLEIMWLIIEKCAWISAKIAKTSR